MYPGPDPIHILFHLYIPAEHIDIGIPPSRLRDGIKSPSFPLAMGRDRGRGMRRVRSVPRFISISQTWVINIPLDENLSIMCMDPILCHPRAHLALPLSLSFESIIFNKTNERRQKGISPLSAPSDSPSSPDSSLRYKAKGPLIKI